MRSIAMAAALVARPEAQVRPSLRRFVPGATAERSSLVLDGQFVDLSSRRLDLSYLNTTYFSASQEETRIASNDVVVETDTGLRVRGVVQASRIANSFEDAQGLTLESVGQELRLTATEDVTLESSTDRVTINSFQGLEVNAQQGDIVMDANNLRLQDLPSNNMGSASYSLCLCRNGKLFRVDASSTCAQGATTLC